MAFFLFKYNTCLEKIYTIKCKELSVLPCKVTNDFPFSFYLSLISYKKNQTQHTLLYLGIKTNFKEENKSWFTSICKAGIVSSFHISPSTSNTQSQDIKA